MKLYVLIAALLSAATIATAQAPTPTPIPNPDGTPGTVLVDTPTRTPGPPRGMQPYAVPAYVRPDAETRRKRFIKSTVHPYALGKMVASSGISTWRNSPEEWGTKWEGFGRRVASSFGRNAIKQTTKFGLDEAFKLDSHFYRSKSKSVGARIRNSVLSPVTARNAEGKRVLGFPNLVATYGSKIVAYEAWYPDRYGWKNGVRSGTFSLGFNVAFNLFKEFVWKKK